MSYRWLDNPPRAVSLYGVGRASPTITTMAFLLPSLVTCQGTQRFNNRALSAPFPLPKYPTCFDFEVFGGEGVIVTKYLRAYNQSRPPSDPIV